MSKKLDFLVKELDPRNDLHRHRGYEVPFEENTRTNLKRMLVNNGIAALSIPKHIVRGGAVGSFLGSVAGLTYSLASGSSEGLVEGATIGVACGAVIDSYIYVLRFLWEDSGWNYKL